ncbi:MAG: hypothetical protein ACREJB_00120, partial [Planctomycetaceae bacterium]
VGEVWHGVLLSRIIQQRDRNSESNRSETMHQSMSRSIPDQLGGDDPSFVTVSVLVIPSSPRLCVSAVQILSLPIGCGSRIGCPASPQWPGFALVS